MENVDKLVYCPTMVFAKMAVLLQLQRIFAPSRAGMVYRSLIALHVLNVLFYTPCELLLIFPCNPREKWWNPLIHGTCVAFLPRSLASAVFNMLFDVCMLLIPLFAITRLQMTTTRKAGICAIFSVGIL